MHNVHFTRAGTKGQPSSVHHRETSVWELGADIQHSLLPTRLETRTTYCKSPRDESSGLRDECKRLQPQSPTVSAIRGLDLLGQQSKRVTGFAADNCNKSGSSDGGVYREHFLLNCVLIRYIAFLAIWLPVRVCDLWKATRYHYRMGNSLWFFKVQHHWLFIVKTDGIYLMEVFMQPRPVFF